MSATPPQPAAGDTQSAGIRVPPPLFYVAGFLIGVGIELAVPIDRPSTAVTLAGAVIGIVVWLALDGAATLFFRRAGTSMIPIRPSTALVTTGPYRFTRNPMYLGMAFLYMGLAFALGFIWPLAVLPVVIVAVDRLVIAVEEAYLLRRFGGEYSEYMKRARRWL
jgi:protein-S-isoprenylcysteine O-methyltransferase Ste14